MGGKRTGAGKYLCCFAAILICFSLTHCASIPKPVAVGNAPPQDEAYQCLVRAQRLVTRGDYEAALQENRRALSLAGNQPPGDEALYASALIYAHPDNPKKDYIESIVLFDRVISEYPQSPLNEQAKIWAEVLRECRELKPSAEPQKNVPDQAFQRIARAKQLLAKGEYEAALEENQKVLSLMGNRPPGDEALYDSALIYAHPGNPKKDYVRSIALLKRLIKEYPRSNRTDQAKVWVQALQDSENSKRVAANLTQENEKLKHMIEESKKVDMEIEEKKREKAR